MIGKFIYRANASLVANNGTKKFSPLPLIKSSLVDRFWCLRCLNTYIDLPDLTGSFLNDTNASMMATTKICDNLGVFDLVYILKEGTYFTKEAKAQGESEMRK